MTNYEWLIQTGNMCDFLRRLVDEEITELNDFYKTSFIDNGFRHFEDYRAVVNWLQSERVPLVKLADVRETITRIMAGGKNEYEAQMRSKLTERMIDEINDLEYEVVTTRGDDENDS